MEFNTVIVRRVRRARTSLNDGDRLVSAIFVPAAMFKFLAVYCHGQFCNIARFSIQKAKKTVIKQSDVSSTQQRTF